MYKEEKPDSWIGTIILSGGTVMERPSRKEGFSWKFFHPLRPSIHAPRVRLRPATLSYVAPPLQGFRHLHSRHLYSKHARPHGFNYSPFPLFLQGPKGELWINILRMPSDYCIFRVATAEEAQSWIEVFKVATYGPHYQDDTERTQETPTPHRGRLPGPPSYVNRCCSLF
jgi:hypothetical protein